MAAEEMQDIPWNQNFIVAVPPDYLYFNKRVTHDGITAYEGLVFDMLFAIASSWNISYTFIDGAGYGTKGDGIFGLVDSGKADIAVGMTGLSYERTKVIDFTPIYRAGEVGFLIRKSMHQGSSSNTQFQFPFGQRVWWSIAGMLAVVVIAWLVIYLCEKQFLTSSNVVLQDERLKISWWDSLMHIIAVILKQSIPDKPNKRTAFHPLLLILMFGGFIIATGYTSNLIAMKAVQTESNIDTLEKLASHPEYRIMVYKNSLEEERFKHSSNKLYQSIWRMINSSESNFVDAKMSPLDIVDKVRSTKAAFMSPVAELKEMSKHDQDLIISKARPGIPAAFGMSKSFRYSERFSIKIQQLFDSGIIGKLEKYYQRNLRRQFLSDKTVSVKLKESTPYFLWLSGGAGLALLTLVIEIVMFHLAGGRGV